VRRRRALHRPLHLRRRAERWNSAARRGLASRRLEWRGEKTGEHEFRAHGQSLSKQLWSGNARKFRENGRAERSDNLVNDFLFRLYQADRVVPSEAVGAEFRCMAGRARRILFRCNVAGTGRATDSVAVIFGQGGNASDQVWRSTQKGE
jgi:hypothetical protein